jgi:hypothetical protein
MFFFLSLRESSTHPGTIEPDILPSSSAASTTSHSGLIPSTKASTSRWSASYYDWITRWDTSDSAGVLRKVVCILALFLHVPMNVLSVVSYGVSFWLFFRIVISVLNLLGVAVSLWKLDEMRGARLVYHKM